MSRREKLLRRLRNNPKNVSLHDLQAVLEAFGFELDRIRGSHHIFVGPVGEEEITLSVPAKHPVQVVYVKRVLELIEEILSYEVNDGEG